MGKVLLIDDGAIEAMDITCVNAFFEVTALTHSNGGTMDRQSEDRSGNRG